jgi:Uncharacterized conserved protein (DUF2163)
MRQAIKGDGSDGTDDLKAYLLAHDAILAQELYEFTKSIVSVAAAAVSGLPILPAPTIPLAPGASVRMIIYPSSVALTQPNGFANGTSRGVQLGLLAVGLGSLKPQAQFSGYSLPTGVDPLSIVAVYSHIAMSGISPSGYDAGVQLSAVESGGTFQTFNRFNNVPGWSQVITSANAWHSGFDFTSVLQTGTFGASLPSTITPADLFDIVPSLVIDLAAPATGLSFGSLISGIGLTDASSPLTYAGKIYVPAHIKNNGFKSKIGLDVDSLQLEWKLRGDEVMVADPLTGATILTMLQGFQQGLWDGVWVKWRRTYMPTFGDCDSLGAVSMFRGRIAEVEVDRLTAKITVNSITEMFNRQIPQQLIEANNRSLQFGPGLPPDLDPDPTHWTVFQCVAGQGGTVQKIVAQQTAPTSGQVYAPGTFDLGYLLFQADPLANIVAQVERYEVIAGYNVFYLFKPLYVDPHSYPLSFTAFVPVPKDQTISGAGTAAELPGFPRVPLPEQAV